MARSTTPQTTVTNTVRLADGWAVRRDGPAGRFYEIDGEMFPSVTHVLSVIAKPALIHWAANQERTAVIEAAADLYEDIRATPAMSRPVYITTLQGRIGKQKAHTRELAKAAEIGSQAHALIERWLREQLGQRVGPEPRVHDGALWAFLTFQQWAQTVELEPLAIEQMVWSRRLGVAGTLDLYARVNGQHTVIDFKTGKAVYRESHLQNAAYQIALREMGHLGVPVDETYGIVFRLPKVVDDPETEIVAVPPVVELEPTLTAAVTLWRWWHEGEQAYQATRATA